MPETAVKDETDDPGGAPLVRADLRPDQQAEIAKLRAQAFTTRRATVTALEEVLYEPLAVLDHGFVRAMDYMGDDGSIVQAARVSYGSGTKKVRQDAALIGYLMRHWHTTPFEMCEIKFHVKLPIFVARQWIRHRTANVNEYSARYSVLDREFYVPAPDQIAVQSDGNAQGRGAIFAADQAATVIELLREDAERCHGDYLWLLNEDDDGNPMDQGRPGLARELARVNLTLSTYTQWYWKTDLQNLMHFLRLRADAHAQYEIRAYAEVMLEIMKRWVPAAHAAFMEYRMGAAQISATGLTVLRRMLDGEPVAQEDSGLSKREWRELMAVLGREG